MFSKGPKHVNGRGPTGTKALLRTLDAKLKRNVDVMVVLAMAGNLLMVAEVYELWARSGVASTTCEVLKLLSSFTTLWLLAFLAWYYQRKFQQMKLTNALLDQDTFVSSGLLAWCVAECLVYAVHAPPFLSAQLTQTYYEHTSGRWTVAVLYTDEALAAAMVVLRTALMVRWLRFQSGVESEQTRGYSNMNHVIITTTLALRLLYKRRPLALIAGSLVFAIGWLAFLLQAFEHGVNAKLASYANCAWCVLTTVATVGFGDVYPVSVLGRAVAGVASLLGLVCAGVIVEVAMRLTQLSKAEARVAGIITQTNTKAKMQRAAAVRGRNSLGAIRSARNSPARNSLGAQFSDALLPTFSGVHPGGVGHLPRAAAARAVAPRHDDRLAADGLRAAPLRPAVLPLDADVPQAAQDVPAPR